MKSIQFNKYTNCGNNFVILDETLQPCVSEKEKQVFARKARDVFFGIGSDGLLVVQPSKINVVQKINDTFGYWGKLPTVDNCDFIFRLFESKGKEAFSCGNGLLCIANYLYQKYGIEKTHIMTQVPLAQPRIVTIGVEGKEKKSWCNIGQIQRAPNNVISVKDVEYSDKKFSLIKEFKIDFRSHDLHPFSNQTTLLLNGYFIYTGEPHLVIFPDEFLSPEIVDNIFFSVKADSKEKRRNFGSWLINHISAFINKNYQNIFPSGVNVSFVRVISNSGIIQYRCYERNINRETLACGTGALAIANIIKELKINTNNKLILLPYRCSWYQPNIYQQVEFTTNGSVLYGQPIHLFSGEINLEPMPVDILDNNKSIPWGMLSEAAKQA